MRCDSSIAESQKQWNTVSKFHHPFPRHPDVSTLAWSWSKNITHNTQQVGKATSNTIQLHVVTMNRNRKQREKKRKKKRKKNRKREKRKRNEKKGRGKRKEKRGKCIRARISSVAARERSFGLAVGASNVSSEYCMGVPVYLVRGRALVQIVRSG